MTDASHPGIHVCFWCEAAVQQAGKGVRPGDIVRLSRVNESSEGRSGGGRFGKSLAARSLTVIWRDGRALDASSLSASSSSSSSSSSFSFSSSSSSSSSAAAVVQWAKHAWPAVCRAPGNTAQAPFLPTLANQSNAEGGALPSAAAAAAAAAAGPRSGASAGPATPGPGGAEGGRLKVFGEDGAGGAEDLELLEEVSQSQGRGRGLGGSCRRWLLAARARRETGCPL